MAASLNRVVIVGNLTRDPELRNTPSGTAVCSLRVAVNSRRKDQTGQWVDKPNYFNVTVFGQQGENCAQYLSKGRPVAVDGRLEIVAETVQFLGSRGDGEGGGAAGSGYIPADTGAAPAADFPSSASDDDIPF
jgi:single-strand DNA-binding protein